MKIFIIIVCIILVITTLIVVKPNKDIKLESSNVSISSSNILNQIDEYQQQFWTVRKNAQEQINKDNSHNSYKKVQQQINQFYNKVESNISKENAYYKQLNSIQNEYNKSFGNLEEITDLNKLSEEYLNNTQIILNDILNEIRSKKNNDYDIFAKQQQEWTNDLKLEQEKIKSQDSGDAMTLTYNSSTQEIIKFRIWLLILYLENINKN